jgi:hypothetical protein
MNKLFCFGYGYTCDYLGHMLELSGGWDLAGTTRDLGKKRLLHERGIDAHIFDYSRPLGDPFFILKDTTHVLISTPPGDDGDPAFLMHCEDILRIPTIKWVGYLSTTSVYGDRAGGWVDETSELRPSSKRGSRRAKAEEQWMSLFNSHKLPVHIFRLAGIYGPGRSALDSVRAGIAKRLEKPGHVFGRIHVEDIASVLFASMKKPAPGSRYNVCDDMPAPSHEVIAFACELLNVDIPPLIPIDEANLAPIARSFYSDNRRTSNRKIKEKLGIEIKYPDYRAGLTACLEAETSALRALQQAENAG